MVYAGGSAELQRLSITYSDRERGGFRSSRVVSAVVNGTTSGLIVASQQINALPFKSPSYGASHGLAMKCHERKDLI